jgi:putative methionine-R-sulfoxide reductase with GAF domain
MIDAILARGDEPDETLRAVVSSLVDDAGCAWAGIFFVEDGELVLGPQAGQADPANRTQVAVLFAGVPVAELAADNPADPALLDAIAPLIAEHCLVGWDTNGESWEP